MYHYTESGLQNVWLENGYKTHKTPYGGGVSFDDVEGLHRAIGKAIARTPRLTGAELRFLRKELGLGQAQLATLLGTSEQNISLWERRGKIAVSAKRLIKVIYLEKLDGNIHVTKMIEELIAQDDVPEERMTFRAGRDGRWKLAA